MRDEDKPFVCYKQGWSIKIVPRGAAGWRAFGLWMAVLTILLAAFLFAMARLDDTRAQIAAIVSFVIATLIWAVAMIRWMKARSEVIDLAELLDLKRQNDGRRVNGGRRKY